MKNQGKLSWGAKERFYLTTEGQAELILAAIKKHDFLIKTVQEDLRDAEAVELDARDMYYIQECEELESELADHTNKRQELEERLHELTGFYSDGLPF